MKQLTELCFEHVQIVPLVDLLIQTNEHSVLVRAESTMGTEEQQVDFSSSGLKNLIEHIPNGSLYWLFENVRLDELTVLNEVGLQVLKYGGVYDLTVSFIRSDRMDRLTLVSLQNWSATVATSLGSIVYYCGLDPASDMQTRYFTNSNLGPLALVE